MPHLEAEHVRHWQEANELRVAAGRAEVAAEEVARHQHELTTAQDRLRAVQADRDALDRHSNELVASHRRRLDAEADAARAAQRR